jgi:hypothetical protein
MRRKSNAGNASRTNRPSRGRRDTDIPGVPTFQPDAESVTAPPSSATEIKDDPADEAVRRMVEAAYT